MTMREDGSEAKVVSTLKHSYFPAFDWEALKAILDNRIIASTNIWVFLLPALMVITEKFPVELSLFPFGSQSPLIITLEVPYNFFLLYFAAIAFFLARLLYILRCPQFLRQYGTATAAINSGVTAEVIRERAKDFLIDYQKTQIHQLSEEFKKIEFLLKVLLPAGKNVKEALSSGKFSDLGSISYENSVRENPGEGTYVVTDPTLPDSNTETISNVSIAFSSGPKKQITSLLAFRQLELQNISRRSARLASSALVSVGFVFVALPLLQGFLAVLLAFLAK
ncbi:hypothetical protein [Loktanella sp. DSM 29012]|uniref:hypothetical protein n=1 Tax=Loktanella sp. DSM 29012 TaxID=1881056 RepID=UPI00115FE74B|nr:hypothetical protein [Loktanella sp. DSM 29012]